MTDTDHLNGYDIVVNPILDTEYDGFKNLDFAPSVRFAHALSNAMTVAVEEYADYGPLHQFLGKSANDGHALQLAVKRREFEIRSELSQNRKHNFLAFTEKLR